MEQHTHTRIHAHRNISAICHFSTQNIKIQFLLNFRTPTQCQPQDPRQTSRGRHACTHTHTYAYPYVSLVPCFCQPHPVQQQSRHSCCCSTAFLNEFYMFSALALCFLCTPSGDGRRHANTRKVKVFAFTSHTHTRAHTP